MLGRGAAGWPSSPSSENNGGVASESSRWFRGWKKANGVFSFQVIVTCCAGKRTMCAHSQRSLRNLRELTHGLPGLPRVVWVLTSPKHPRALGARGWPVGGGQRGWELRGQSWAPSQPNIGASAGLRPRPAYSEPRALGLVPEPPCCVSLESWRSDGPSRRGQTSRGGEPLEATVSPRRRLFPARLGGRARMVIQRKC